MKNNQIESKLDLTPSWEFAVQVYMSVLDNPDAPASGRMEAKKEIMRLARMADKMNQTMDKKKTLAAIRYFDHIGIPAYHDGERSLFIEVEGHTFLLDPHEVEQRAALQLSIEASDAEIIANS